MLIKQESITSRAYSRKYGHVCGITKKGQESLVKGHSFGFLPLIFANLGHLERYTPSKWYVFLEVLVEKKAFCFSKRALCASTACNKWLK